MALRTREQAVRAALAKKTNVPGSCQQTVREYFNSPSVGDVDGDGSSDAEDGWKSEPPKYRHSDRNPPRGVPGTFRGGSHDNWHRVITLGNGLVRSTDFDGVTKRYSPGKMGNGTIAEVERAMGQPWEGWSQTIGGKMIPQDEPKGPLTRGGRIDMSIRKLTRAKGKAKSGTHRSRNLTKALSALKRIKPWRKK